MAAAYGQRPHTFLGGQLSEWAAYQVDSAAFYAGRTFEVEARKKGPRSPDARTLPDSRSVPDDPARYAGVDELAQAFGGARRMKIPENGVW